VAAAKAEAKPSKPQPKSAKEAVEAGLAEFGQRRDYDEAVRLFKAAMGLKPSSEEAAAALFNLGCAYAKQRKFKDAAEAIGDAINNHSLKISVALQVRIHAPSSAAMLLLPCECTEMGLTTPCIHSLISMVHQHLSSTIRCCGMLAAGSVLEQGGGLCLPRPAKADANRAAHQLAVTKTESSNTE
jgi:tetratricopeptide (TPR) repeat protein